MSACKDRREFEQHMKGMGLEIIDVRTRNHYVYKVRHPGGEVFSVITPATASDYRAWKNKTAWLRKKLSQIEEKCCIR